MKEHKKGSKHRLIDLLIIPCVLLLLVASVQAATLEPKTGARPLGMSAFAAVADDINAICWNPAGLTLLQSQEATASYAPVYGDAEIVQNYLAYAYPTGKWGTFGINLSYLDYGDMDWRDVEGSDLGVFSRSDYSVYASYGMRLIESLSLGVSLGTTSVSMDSVDDSATGVGIDFGLLYTIASRASIGFYLENIGGVSASDREIARQKIRTGAAVSVLDRPDMGLILALDVEEQQGKLDTLYSGVEWSIFSPSTFFTKRKLQERYINLKKSYGDMADYGEGLPEQSGRTSLCIRTGIKKRLAVDEPMTFSGGFCVKYKIRPKSLTMRIEHAFSLHSYLGTTHRISLGFEMGRMVYSRPKPEEKPIAEPVQKTPEVKTEPVEESETESPEEIPETEVESEDNKPLF